MSAIIYLLFVVFTVREKGSIGARNMTDGIGSSFPHRLEALQNDPTDVADLNPIASQL